MMQRISVPGRAPQFIDLGVGAASSGEIRGTIATPLPTRPATGGRWVDPVEVVERREAQRRAWNRAYRRAKAERDPAWVERERQRNAEARRVRMQDPEWRERERQRLAARRIAERAVREAEKAVAP